MALITSLISAWELNEASGNAVDSHGSFTLTDNNAVGSGTGLVYGTVRDFESSTGQWFNTALSGSLDIPTGSDSWTLELWLNLESYGAGTPVPVKIGNQGPLLYYTSGGLLRLYNQRNGNDISSGVTLSLSTWYHVVAWGDGSDNSCGFRINDTAAGTGSSVIHTNGAGGDFILGRESSGGNYLDGRMGPVRFWRRVLTSGERTTLYNSGAGLPYSSFAGGGAASTVFVPAFAGPALGW